MNFYFRSECNLAHRYSSALILLRKWGLPWRSLLVWFCHHPSLGQHWFNKCSFCITNPVQIGFRSYFELMAVETMDVAKLLIQQWAILCLMFFTVCSCCNYYLQNEQSYFPWHDFFLDFRIRCGSSQKSRRKGAQQ